MLRQFAFGFRRPNVKRGNSFPRYNSEIESSDEIDLFLFFANIDLYAALDFVAARASLEQRIFPRFRSSTIVACF